MKPKSIQTVLTAVTCLIGVAFYGCYIYLHMFTVGTRTPLVISYLGAGLVVFALFNLAYAVGVDDKKHSKLQMIAYIASDLLLLPLAIAAIVTLVMAIPFILGL